MANLKDLKAERDKRLAHAREISNTATHPENQAAGNAVIEMQLAIVAHITQGAKPCPVEIEVTPAVLATDGTVATPAVTRVCGLAPTGLEQPAGRGRSEFEVGCPVCRTIAHTDGTTRRVSVRGGLLPKHAVDAWNEGPDQWTIVPVEAPPAAVSPAESVPS